MPYSRIYLDSNIFIRALESPKEDATAQQLITLLSAGSRNGSAVLSTSQITLAETLVHPIRNGDELLRLQYEQLLSVTSPWLQVAPISRQTLVLSAQLRAQRRLKLPDAIHLASAIMTKCSHFLSRDGDFKMDDPSWSGPQIIRPTEDMLDSLTTWLRS